MRNKIILIGLVLIFCIGIVGAIGIFTIKDRYELRDSFAGNPIQYQTIGNTYCSPYKCWQKFKVDNYNSLAIVDRVVTINNKQVTLNQSQIETSLKNRMFIKGNIILNNQKQISINQYNTVKLKSGTLTETKPIIISKTQVNAIGEVA